MAFSQNVRSATQISSFVSAQVQTRGLAPKTANRYREILSALQLGTYSLTFGANNGVGTAANQAFTLSVYQAPAITSASTATFTVGTSASFAVTTTGFPNAVTGESGTLPKGLTFVDNGNGTATLSGTPTTADGGTYGHALDD